MSAAGFISDQDAIAAFLARHKPRRFEPGATGSIFQNIEWLKDLGFKVQHHSAAIPLAMRKCPVSVNGKKMTRAEFVALVSSERRKRGLEPLTPDSES